MTRTSDSRCHSLQMILIVVMSIMSCPLACGEDQEDQANPAEKLKQLEAQIAEAPEDPMLLYQKARWLMELGKRDAAYTTAKDAMPLFIKKGNRLSWMLLEQIDLDPVRVDVHFNMGPRERKPPDTGIIRPLSFRIWEKGEKPELLETIDFEIGLSNGKPLTAALGQTTRSGHANFGILDTDSTYTKIRKRLLELVKARHAKKDR